MALFDVREGDRRFYLDRLQGFLPDALIDIHTHVWLRRFQAAAASGPLRAVTWPARVAAEQPIEDLIETYRLMFPGKTVTPMVFSSLLDGADDFEAGNAYVAESAARHGFPALLFSRPDWPAEELEARILAGGFLGVKSYLTLADSRLPVNGITVFDFIPPAHLEVLNRHGWIAMVHLPRDGRLRDPVNLEQMLEIERRYPDARVIVAHVGRAYCPEDVGNAFETLRPTRRLLFDISANTNGDVFRRLIDTVGPKRILFGSDLPIVRMRMRRLCERGNYVNLVPRGLYGDVSGDSHMREADDEEGRRLTFFLYEEIEAFRQAASGAGLNAGDIRDVFHDNAARLIAGARAAGAGKKGGCA